VISSALRGRSSILPIVTQQHLHGRTDATRRGEIVDEQRVCGYSYIVASITLISRRGCISRREIVDEQCMRGYPGCPRMIVVLADGAADRDRLLELLIVGYRGKVPLRSW
jgi:hypothetical protein